MYIRTQDRRSLLNIANFSITRNYGGKLKFALIGTSAAPSIFENSKVLGLYKKEAEIIQELDKIHKHLESSSDTTVYQIN